MAGLVEKKLNVRRVKVLRKRYKFDYVFGTKIQLFLDNARYVSQFRRV